MSEGKVHEFLTEEESAAVERVLEANDYKSCEYLIFWGDGTVLLDGTFTLQDLCALVAAMSELTRTEGGKDGIQTRP